MKTINDDSEGFFENGGWSFLEPESDTEEDNDDDEEEEDETFEVSDDGGTSEDESDSEEYSEVDEDDDDDDSGGSGNNSFLKINFVYYRLIKIVFLFKDAASSEESGKDWSDLEAEAAEADKNQRGGFEDEYTRSKGHGSSGPSKRPAHSSSSSSRHRESPSKKHKRYDYY